MRITDKSPKTYMVLGMHKSGTSFIAKSLHDQGINMGVPDSTKEETLYEHIDFNKLNVDILKRAGGSWDNPPSEVSIKRVMEHSLIKEKISKLINKLKEKFWGFKDPRTSLTAKGILPHLKDDVYLVCIFRRPEKAIASLQRQSKMSKAKCLSLYKEYNRRIVDTIRVFCEI